MTLLLTRNYTRGVSAKRMREKENLTIDSTVGGGGDIWMRLVGLYAVSGIKPNLKIEILIPGFLRNLARYTFGDRLNILDEAGQNEIKLCYTVMGIRHLLPGIISGKRFISPYQRAVIKDKKTTGPKDVFNILIYQITDLFGWVQVPAAKWIPYYQGFLEVIAIKQLRWLNYEQFAHQLEKDAPLIYSKLNADIPLSPELSFPEDLKDNVVIFPTGTSRQFIPLEWAKENLPNAYYAFFHKDPSLVEFKSKGLKTVAFYKEAGDIIALSKKAGWTLSTDSFPSHLLQYATDKCAITITEVLRSRIISPVFKGKVIDSVVACHPCLHLNRTVPCAAGYMECLNWKNKVYTQNIVNSLPQ